MVEAVFEKLNVAEDLSWTPGNVDSLVEVVGIRDTCRYPDLSQILTTILSNAISILNVRYWGNVG